MYLCKTELFEIELFICIKINSVLINRERLMCHKIQPNKTKQLFNELLNAENFLKVSSLLVFAFN